MKKLEEIINNIYLTVSPIACNYVPNYVLLLYHY